jgi:NADP-dependent 3-hydroxy acid dehydrogenase YdfG
LSQQLNCYVIGADVKVSENVYVDEFVQLPQTPSLPELCTALAHGLDEALTRKQSFFAARNDQDSDNSEKDLMLQQDNVRLDAVICAAGGWQGDDGGAEALQAMLQVNLHPVLAVANVVLPSRCAPHALCVFMGATVALQGTPGMLGYGTAKAGVHHVVTTLAAYHPQTLGKKQKPTKPTFPVPIAILPTTLDTMANRVAMPNADTSKWTNCTDVAEQIGQWITTPSLRPAPGSLVKVYTQKDTGEAVFELARC